MSEFIVLIVQVLIALYVARYYYKYFTRQSPLPGPFPLPLIGNLHQVKLNAAQYAMDHHKEFGDMFEIWVGSKRFIYLSHPSLIDQVYVSNATCKFFPRLQMDDVDAGVQGLIFNGNFQTWKRDRKFVTQSLMSPRFLRNFTHITESLFNENERFWDKREYHIDFAKWIKCFTTDITLQAVTRKPSYCLNTYLFGEDNSDPIKYEEIKRSNKFIHAVQGFLLYALFQTFIPKVLQDYVPGFYHLNKKYKEDANWLNETALDIVKKRRNEIEQMSNNENVGSNLLDVLLTLNTQYDLNGYDKDETPLNDQEISRIIKEISITGIDTTGNTFCFTLWLLSRHPKVLARFQKEIKESIGDDLSRQITYEDLEKFTYLDAIIKESMRVIPLVPMSPRTLTQESIIGGKCLNADTKFFVHQEQIHRSPDCWKDPDQYIPERFLKGSDNEIEIVKNSFIPFGGGMRICPGRHMALVELKTLLILLYRKYDIEFVDKESKRPNYRYLGTYECTDMKVIVRPRKDVNV